jgi:hypothetical protein
MNRSAGAGGLGLRLMTAHCIFGRQPNPLRRRSDRVEACSRIAALLLWIAAIPLAVRVGVAVHDGLAAQAATATSWQAVVLSDPVCPTWREACLPNTATAGWTTAHHVDHTAVTRVPLGARRGSHFTLWTDGAGRPTTPPASPTIRWTDGLVAAAGVLLGALAVLGLALLALRRALDRRRYRAWDLEWLLVGASRPRR